MNLEHAVHAMGYAACWLTGWAAFSDRVRDLFGAAPERIAGFVFIGTPGKPLEERPRPDMAKTVQPGLSEAACQHRDGDSARRIPGGGPVAVGARARRRTRRQPADRRQAYQSFQDDGYVEVRRGVGMFVLPGAVERLKVAERDRFLTSYWPKVREHIGLLGLSARELLDREIA
ncbi:putative uncharacterized HTH-type transcriptional regulator YhcF-like [Ditylenchus destructor]|uniref:Uncharacterized HTH-type transcriptional regulator YhcF-like n=1 Tax=Ditylenchus destructor TaxID=166010 RepID=A0AAD4MIH9_9BILA|nr:putative uncharacterized HTH-type transcriptional regulator YhcF-like [Ditylenchus destructor]